MSQSPLNTATSGTTQLAPVFELRDVIKTFPGVRALDGASLRIYPGRVMALLGENGAGKSTLMKVMTGIHKQDSGTLFYQGKQVDFKGPRDSQSQGVGIIHQELNLINELSIAENIFLGQEPVGRFGRINKSLILEKSRTLMERLNIRIDPRTLVGSLNLGMQQMVEIARSLSMDSKVIVMDEPTDALTDTETESLFQVIRQLREEGTGIVYISHRLQEIFAICDDVTVLRDGQFVSEDPIGQLNEDRLIEHMVGRSISEQYPRVACEPGSTVLEVKNLCGDGLHDINFSVKEGEVLGFSGLMGAGRTELMRTVYGARHMTSGNIISAGKPIAVKRPADALNHGIVYISEDRKGDGLILDLPIHDNMTLSSLKRFVNQSGYIDRRREQKSIDHYVKAFNIKAPSTKQLIRNLSGGNQQKVAIAKGLMTQPRLLILDEPTRGVDVGAKREIYQLINELKVKGMSIIIISSDLPEVIGVSDRIMVMHNGTITGEFKQQNATQENLMQSAVAHTG